MYTAPSLRRASEPRRGLILMVVLALITAFAIVGLSFVLYADSEAKAAQIARDAEQGLIVNPYDVDPKAILSNFLGQLIHDADDDALANSSLRGHSLARSMFGYNYDQTTKLPLNNTTPFNGIGRLHNTQSFGSLGNVDEYNLINYKQFPADGFLRDPERPGTRTASGKANWLGGFNAPYTYPDANNMFLATVDSSGNVLQPSYHRQGIFGTLYNTGSPTGNPYDNPNWGLVSSNAIGKYLTLRPRPVDNNGFPYPEDVGGDVKNLVGNPGGNDSIWVDGGSPVRTAANGKTFKVMFAPLIVEMDSRLNLTAHGNVLGGATPTPTHLSNTGWGPWSVNLGLALKNYSGAAFAAADTEWGNLFTGVASPSTFGRYGNDGVPGNSAAPYIGGGFPIPATAAGLFPTLSGHAYSRINFDDGMAGGTAPLITRTPLGGPFSPLTSTGYFPTFLSAYTTTATPTPLTNHPFAYNSMSNTGDDHSLSVSSMEALLRFNDTTSSSLTGDLPNLCPTLFGQTSPRPRNMVTTRGFDIDAPGISPALTSRTGSYLLSTGALRPSATTVGFPNPPTSIGSLANNPNTDFTAGDGRMNFQVSNAMSILSKRLDLNRPLPDYPTPAAGVMSSSDPKFLAAQQARQDFARDIFDRLRLVTGADDPASVTPGSQQKDALRWLAQLSANIVDFIDNDDIMTPFNWNPGTLADTVYGTEQPRLLINEVLVQYQNPTTGLNAGKTIVDTWVELMNPAIQDPIPTNPDGGAARVSNSNGNCYRLSICTFGSFSTITNVVNSTGYPDAGFGPPPFPDPAPTSPPSLVQKTQTTNGVGCIVGPEFNNTPGMVVPPYNTGSGTPVPGFLLVSPTSPPTTGGTSPFSAITPQINSANLSYTISPATPSPLVPTILLQRLACPYIPQSASNPFVAVDIFQNACDFTGVPPLVITNNVTTPGSTSNTDNRPNPYMDHISGLAAAKHNREVTSSTGNIKNTFGRLNTFETGPNQWLVQLDRYLSSPMELLHVSGYKPHELTQFFGDNTVTTQMGTFNHRVPWFDEDVATGGASSHRLYRFFELVETRSRMAGMEPAVFQPTAGIPTGSSAIPVQSLATITTSGSLVTMNVGDVLTIVATDGSGTMENVRVSGTATAPSLRINLATPTNQAFSSFVLVHTATGGRVPGKLNLNTVFDAEIFNALCDASIGNNFKQSPDVDNMFPVFGGLIRQSSPPFSNTTIDQPSIGNALAQFPASDPQYPNTNGSGINRTLFRPGSPSNPGVGFFEPSSFAGANAHPYQRYELLNKIFNNTTSRSNVFAVWLTVGFFECDATGTILGPEIGKSEGKSIRHRMFAIVDHTGLAVPRAATNLASQSNTGTNVMTVNSTVGITTGTQLLVGTSGTTLELVSVGSIQGNQIVTGSAFTQTHVLGEAVLIAPGNWGPQPGFDVTQPVNSQIVPYYSIIE
jgi:hypothetical protein